MYHGTTTTVYSRTMQVNLAGELALGVAWLSREPLRTFS